MIKNYNNNLSKRCDSVAAAGQTKPTVFCMDSLGFGAVNGQRHCAEIVGIIQNNGRPQRVAPTLLPRVI